MVCYWPGILYVKGLFPRKVKVVLEKALCQFSSPVTMWRLIEALWRFFYVTVSLKQKECLAFG